MKKLLILFFLFSISLISQTETQCKATNELYRTRCTEMTADTSGLCPIHKEEYQKHLDYVDPKPKVIKPEYNRIPYSPPDTGYIPPFNVHAGIAYTREHPTFGLGFRAYVVGLSCFIFNSDNSGVKVKSSGLDFNVYLPFTEEFSVQLLVGKQWAYGTATFGNYTSNNYYSSFYFGYGFQYYVNRDLMLGATVRTANEVIKLEWNWLMINLGIRF